MNDQVKRILKEVIVANQGFIRSFEWKDRGNSRQTSARIVGIPVKFRTHRLPNKSLERTATATGSMVSYYFQNKY
jgi:hypothetical protein